MRFGWIGFVLWLAVWIGLRSVLHRVSFWWTAALLAALGLWGLVVLARRWRTHRIPPPSPDGRPRDEPDPHDPLRVEIAWRRGFLILQLVNRRFSGGRLHVGPEHRHVAPRHRSRRRFGRRDRRRPHRHV